jgi:hypothetical protein
MIDAPYSEVELEVAQYLRTHVPRPRRGGTFFYCPWNIHVRVGGRTDHWFCGTPKAGWATGTRFRTAAAYRRHYRRDHL